jgi:CRISPR-associated protein Csb1
MSVSIDGLTNEPRLLLEAALKPVQGDRFQATGFPDLGPATYTLPAGTEMLLVESAQSMANRLEAVCWDDAETDVAAPLKGLPYVRVDLGEFGETCSILEFHRLNSPYIWDSEDSGDRASADFCARVRDAVGVSGRRRRRGSRKAEEDAAASAGGGGSHPGPLDMRRLAQAALRYDPNSLLHGLFLEKVDGRLRIPRLLSAFLEARGVRTAESGGVKLDRVFPAGGVPGIASQQGYTNVPFSRTEFTADSITAYFNLDLATLRGYGLGEVAERMLVTLSLWKIRRFLDSGLRLRTACDLDCLNLKVTRPDGFEVPVSKDLDGAVRDAIAACGQAGLFADPPVTRITWKAPKKAAARKGDAEGEPEEE